MGEDSLTMSNPYFFITNSADLFTRLRIAGMNESEMRCLKENIVKVSIDRKIDAIKLLTDCVEHYEKLQLIASDKVESEVIKSQLRSKGIEC